MTAMFIRILEWMGIAKPVIMKDLGFQFRADTENLVRTKNPRLIFSGDRDLISNSSRFKPGETIIITGPSYHNLEMCVDEMPLSKWKAFGYDLENWIQTPKEEQADPVGYYEKASNLCHKNGKLMFGVPGSGYMRNHNKYFSGMAKVCDGWIILGHGYQSLVGLSGFRVAMQEIIAKVRVGNPTCPIWIQLSVTSEQGPVIYTAEQIIEFKNVVIDLVTGVTIFDRGDPEKPKTLNKIVDLWNRSSID